MGTNDSAFLLRKKIEERGVVCVCVCVCVCVYNIYWWFFFCFFFFKELHLSNQEESKARVIRSSRRGQLYQAHTPYL